ncbi:MAG TPA: hypothetical protein VHX14_02130 [Thermoanaerobaculia bacterium]|jgi:hypothetical protein|nr:hypothetical protein [Thermoanaerobaculia bacterium]
MNATPKSPWVLAGCGCLSFLLALILFVAAYFAGGSHVPSLTSGSSTDDAVVYRNTREGRTGKLAENYTGFEFRYPKSWALKPDPDAANFVTVERAVNGQTFENLNAGYFSTAGSTEKNQALYPALIAQFQAQFEQQFHDLKKISEGATKVGSYDGWEGLFTSTTGDDDKKVSVYTRVILLPNADGTKGVTLLLMGTSLCPDLSAPEDLGKKGELPGVLESFKFVE